MKSVLSLLLGLILPLSESLSIYPLKPDHLLASHFSAVTLILHAHPEFQSTILETVPSRMQSIMISLPGTR